jgi:N-acetylglucosaminyldiphosphoundecaprenol N-acetyl-beta-D-mannosaminyltransferase
MLSALRVGHPGIRERTINGNGAKSTFCHRSNEANSSVRHSESYLKWAREEVPSFTTNMSNQVSPNPRSFLMGFPVDSVTMEEAVNCVGRCLQANRFHHVAAINANKLWLSDRNSALTEILRRAELVIPEYAIVWACRVLKRPVRGHIGGVMLLKEILPWLEKEQFPVYFLGARPEVLELLKISVQKRFPKLKIAGAHSGYFEPTKEEEIVESINESGAAVLFVAMGSPRQEFWIERHRKDLRVKVAMGVGGSFDVLSGIKKDAPSWVRCGGEWLYRLIQDPRNLWKRYLKTNPWFVYRVLRERLLADR